MPVIKEATISATLSPNADEAAYKFADWFRPAKQLDVGTEMRCLLPPFYILLSKCHLSLIIQGFFTKIEPSFGNIPYSDSMPKCLLFALIKIFFLFPITFPQGPDRWLARQKKSEESESCGLVLPDNTGILTKVFSAKETQWETF